MVGRPLSEAELVERAKRGDQDAYGELVHAYQGIAFRTAYLLTGSAADAEDAAQDAFVKAYQHLATFDSRYRFYSWMYRILVNECLNVNRDRRSEEPLDSFTAGGIDPFDSAVAAERVVQVNMALEQLTPEYRAVVVLRHFGGQSYGEIAEALGIPEKTVKSRLYTARQQLGEKLLGWKGSEEDED